ncbi:MAG: hypothetical protein IJE25_08720 [Clostridia bacterium]|nr:hypothetical protein [Clostridia bacterium]
MTKKCSTKKALIASLLSLVICVSMLVGTTFAWFTDSVTSANNIIASGNLDVELYYQVEGQSDWTKVTDNTNVFKEDTLWEPGHTEVVKLKVVNEGTLALKYQLGVNVASEVGSVNVNDVEFKLSDFIKFGIVDGAQSYTRDQAIAAAEANGATALKTAYNSTVTALAPQNEKIVTMVVYMPTTVGNEADAKAGAAVPTINLGINLFATQMTAESDSFNDQYDKNAIIVTNAAEAQAALDSAEAGATIKLAPGVNYGTLLLRPVDGNANTTTSLNEADGEGLTVYRNEYIRKVENLTIIGAPGATVDAIKVESGYISGSSCNLVDVKGLVIDSVEFTDKADCAPHTYSAPIFFNLTWTDVDGLTVKNCKLIGNDDKVNFVYFTIDGSGAFDGVASNVTITGNTVDGIARLCELRQTENVTITDNVIKNTVLHGMLLTVHNGVYAGNVTIIGNTAYGIGDRFVRMAGAGDANVVIKDNTNLNYEGDEADYIKVTDSNGTPVIENNVIGRSVYGLTLIPDGVNSKIIVSDKEGLLNLTKLFADWTALFTDGNGTTYTNYANGAGADYYYSGRWTVNLGANIDLGNDTIDPIILKHPVSTGNLAFNGNNYTISNAKIVTDATTENEAGLFNANYVAFKNLKLDNIHVVGSNKGNSTAGILSGSANVDQGIENIAISNSSVTGGKYTGGVVGYGYTDVANCTLTNVTVKGGYKLGGIIGYICASGGTGDVTGNTLIDCTVDGIGNNIFAGGKDKYVIGQVVGNYNCNGTCNNNTITNITTSAAEIIGEIEAGKTVTQ